MQDERRDTVRQRTEEGYEETPVDEIPLSDQAGEGRLPADEAHGRPPDEDDPAQRPPRPGRTMREEYDLRGHERRGLRG